MPAYWVVNLHSSYKVSQHVELFGLVNNLFDRHYYVYGTFFDVTSFPYLNLTDPRTFVPGMPFAAYAGMRANALDATEYDRSGQCSGCVPATHCTNVTRSPPLAAYNRSPIATKLPAILKILPASWG